MRDRLQESHAIEPENDAVRVRANRSGAGGVIEQGQFAKAAARLQHRGVAAVGEDGKATRLYNVEVVAVIAWMKKKNK
jgi:hypothetical protein